MTAEQAAYVCAEKLPADPIDRELDARAEVPAFESWRQRIAAEFSSEQER
jgi:hypothetical protein